MFRIYPYHRCHVTTDNFLHHFCGSLPFDIRENSPIVGVKQSKFFTAKRIMKGVCLESRITHLQVFDSGSSHRQDFVIFVTGTT